ncbi:hypothetical protein Y032_0635g914 [Ancylostoma ceylanicum]|uniref:Rab-GAP TBC domain-containing protein n=1 Tax=Ancylostoma ceylanicum TaxID=53326 RepID=A0A016WL03_9BILA|nr:hypothetical protein Y032_0635g914 [Ancylostoma ceylanicum]
MSCLKSLDISRWIPGNEYEPPLPNIFSMHWFLTLFATCLPRDCVLRLWDALMLQGSEVLLRTAIALWSKMSRKILRTSTADEFYSLMGKLCKELAEMNEEEQDQLMTVVYSIADFPYPGLAELREKYTWNIHPLSATFKLFRKSVTDILHDDSSDGEPSCSPCSGRRRKDAPTWSDLRELEKRYYLTKQRQKQAAVIINSAYLHGLNALSNASKQKAASLIAMPRSQPALSHIRIVSEISKWKEYPSVSDYSIICAFVENFRRTHIRSLRYIGVLVGGAETQPRRRTRFPNNTLPRVDLLRNFAPLVSTRSIISQLLISSTQLLLKLSSYSRSCRGIAAIEGRMAAAEK